MNRSLEETYNTLSHGLGLLLSLLGCALLFTWQPAPLTAGKILTLSIFGVSLVMLYLASTLYHAEKNLVRKRFLKYCDHAAIFLLIAGTYTPFAWRDHGTAEGHWLVFTIWTMAVLGIVSKIFLVGRFRFVSTLLYLLMGWVAVFFWDFLKSLPREELYWLVAGGLSYTIGTVFYLWRRLPFSHAIWHLFVLGGSACHYIGVLLYRRA